MITRWRTQRPLAALVMTAVTLGAGTSFAAAADRCPRTSEVALEQQVMCLVCGIPLALADSPQADRERAFIVDRVNRCQTAAQIKAALVAQYGPSVLSLPPPRGFALSAYLIPIVGVVLAAAGVGFVLLRRRRLYDPDRTEREALAPPPTRRELAMVDAELARDKRGP